MTESMVEKVTAVIYEGMERQLAQSRAEEIARAAIEAMREPTRNMRGAAVKAKVPPGGFTRGYQAIIDAALAEKDKADA